MAVDGKPRAIPAELADDDRKHCQKKVLDDLAKREHESAGDRDKRLKAEAKERREEATKWRTCSGSTRSVMVERQRLFDGQPMIVVDFAPRPGAAPQTGRDGGGADQAPGAAPWISEDDYQAGARLEAVMIADVSIIGVFIGKLYKGTAVSMDRRKANGGCGYAGPGPAGEPVRAARWCAGSASSR